MSILSKLKDLIKKLIKSLIKLIKNLIKKLWPVILLVLAVYFAPVIGGWFMANGFTALGSFFATIGTTLTPALTSFIGWAWSGVSSMGGAAWSAFRGLELTTQAGLVAGAAAMIAPEETAAVISEVADTAFDFAVGAITGTSLFPLLLIGGGLYLFFGVMRRRKDQPDQGYRYDV